MRITYDNETDSAYIYLVEDSEVARTTGTEDGINLDFDEDGMLLGIEVLDAKGKLPQPLLDEADSA